MTRSRFSAGHAGSPSRRRKRHVASGLGLLWLVGAVAGCDGRAPLASPSDGVAEVGDVLVSRSELDLYLSLNLLPRGEEGADAEGLGRVKSRLLDALIDEKTFLIEAERRRLAVSDAEVDAYLGGEIEDEPVVDSLTDKRRRHLVRQRLMVQKLQEILAAGLPPPDEEEVRAHIERSRGRLAPRKRVKLRALRFDAAEDTARTAERIRSGRMNFAEAVANYETGPGQGVLLELSWGTLSPEIRDALEDLEPGQVSAPVDFSGDTYLFQLDSWLVAPAEMGEELIRRARRELQNQRRRGASEELLLELRKRTPVVIHEERLPFRYVR